jgi:hypothetical protein
MLLLWRGLIYRIKVKEQQAMATRNVYELLAILLGAVNEHADALSGLVDDTEGEDSTEAHESYRLQLAELELAIDETRELLRLHACLKATATSESR